MPPSHQIKIVRILFLAKPYRDATIIVITINPEKLCEMIETLEKEVELHSIVVQYDGKKINRFDISFYNDDVTTLKNVTIEDGIETIGGGFVQCSKLEKVVIPSSVTKIEKGEFRYSKDTVTLYVKKGSYAEKYAKKNKLRYKYSK